MKQTAVEWLIEQLREYDFSPRDNTYLIEIPSWIWIEKFEQAKAMEKQQIMNAHNQGYADGYRDNGNSPIDYYNETFKSE